MPLAAAVHLAVTVPSQCVAIRSALCHSSAVCVLNTVCAQEYFGEVKAAWREPYDHEGPPLLPAGLLHPRRRAECVCVCCWQWST